jgi:hypothetical protein
MELFACSGLFIGLSLVCMGLALAGRTGQRI